MSAQSALLQLPAELRIQIFEYIFETIQCQRLLFVLDSVYVQSDAGSTPKNTAILHACRSTYKECLPILYNHTTVELSVRDEQNTNDVRASMISLGTIKDCGLFSRLRHVEVEINFNAFDDLSVLRAAFRVLELSEALNKHGKVKTLSLTFLQLGSHGHDHRTRCDAVVEQAVRIKCEKLLEVSRNMGARNSMSMSRWTALRRLAATYVEAEPEQFHEISLDYWDRVFPVRGESDSSY